jgi:lipid-A-disaccharide synthase
MIRVENIGLVNLIAGKKIVPELIQEEASANRIADTVIKMLSDPSGLKQLSLELLSLRDKLGGPGASGRVAEIAFGMLGEKRYMMQDTT